MATGGVGARRGEGLVRRRLDASFRRASANNEMGSNGRAQLAKRWMLSRAGGGVGVLTGRDRQPRRVEVVRSRAAERQGLVRGGLRAFCGCKMAGSRVRSEGCSGLAT